ncbi:MAG: hypothetical protein J3R72DRAFT_460210 [Linnemannia gamsii]|nr:MAG: hypothetical protein J3R72DRAFT_460210 [Linnemannia gamsii]
MLFNKQSIITSASASTATTTTTETPPLPVSSTTTTISTHDTDSKYSHHNNRKSTPASMTGTSKDAAGTSLLYARVHGVVLAGFIWSAWCCDHYQQSPLVTLLLLLTGVLYFIWWCRRSTAAASPSLSPLPSQPSLSLSFSKLADDLSAFPPWPTEQKARGVGEGLLVPGVPYEPAHSLLSSSASTSSIATASVSACSVSCDITVSVVAQDLNNSSNRNNSTSLGMSMPSTPTDPPPPYSHNNNNHASGSGSDDGIGSGQCMQSEEDQQQQKTTKSGHQRLYYIRQRMLVHLWGAGGCLVGLVSWVIVSELEPILLSILEAKVDQLELELNDVTMLFTVCCWIAVAFVWVIYVLATRYLMSRCGSVNGSRPGAGTWTGTSEQLAKKEMVSVVVKKGQELELELEHKEQECEEHKEQQQEFGGNVNVRMEEDMSEIGQDMDGAQKQQQQQQKQQTQSVIKVPSMRILRRPIPCRQQTETTITIKRHRRGLTPNNTWTRSITLLQQVKHEIQIWSFSLWVLAPTIPRSFGQHQHERYYHLHGQDVNSARNDSRREKSHPQRHESFDKQDGGLLLTTSGFQDVDRATYESARSEATSGIDGSMTVDVVALKEESYEQDLIQHNENTGGDLDVFPLVEKQPSFAQPQHRHQPPHPPPQRTGYMSQSMPDLHAVKRTGAVESTLARWSRMTLDPERLGSIFQYYLRQRASTLKKERQTDGYYGNGQDSTIMSDDDLQDSSDDDYENVNNENGGVIEDEDPSVAFLIRSSTLPTVRVGLYGADQKRLWTSSGSVHLSPLPEDEEKVEEEKTVVIE